MNIVMAIVLGMVQGLTEFLPVSSSGHLVIIQSFLPSFSQPGILLEVVLHFGTLFSVLLYFRKKISSYLRIRYLYLLFIGTLPAVIVGLLFKNQIEALFQSVKIVGLALIITGTLNLLIDKLRTKPRTLTPINSLLTGIAQAVAIVPGISRSGSTIFAAVAQGIKKKEAVEFSFLLSVPAVLGANLLEIFSAGRMIINQPEFYFFGFLASLAFGFLAIGLVFKFIAAKNFKYFGYYCFILGAISLILAGKGVGR